MIRIWNFRSGAIYPPTPGGEAAAIEILLLLEIFNEQPHTDLIFRRKSRHISLYP